MNTIEEFKAKASQQDADSPLNGARLLPVEFDGMAECDAGHTERILNAAVEILTQGEDLLSALTAESFTRKVPVVFNASIGGHYRHCLDHFTSLLLALDADEVDYDHRKRDPRIETQPDFALTLTAEMRRTLEQLTPDTLCTEVKARCEVSYAHGNSPVTRSTLARELVYCIAHAIHHYALISVMARLMEVKLPEHFGVAPSTVAHQKEAAANSTVITDAAIKLPLGFHEWFPVVQAATLALLTFVQEDAPTVSAALLSAAGSLNTATGFLGCFFGIWIGDALLYLVARGFGRSILSRPWAGRFLNPASVVRSEQWFAQRGTWLLLSSRLIPGTRLPTYLAAGFLRIPFSKFLLVTGIAVTAWTVAIFLLARTFGSRLLHFLERWQGGGWALMTVVLLLLVALRLSMKLTDAKNRRRIAAAFGRCTRWEFWPAWLFYIPVFINYLWLAIRYRGFTLPTAANPGIFSGGIVGESKIATLRELHATSSEFTAEAHLIEGASVEERQEAFQRLITAYGISYPLILKPDVGQRGVGVKLIRDERQAHEYLTSTNAPLICQPYAPGPQEIGVFYYRFPGEPRGCIFSITEKVFPIIVGDGVHTVEELIWADRRGRFIADKYIARLGVRRDEILPKGEMLKLVEAGNHAQGCIFRDGMHLWSEELERRIDEISQKLNGFFIGRYDVRYASQADLRAGRNFQIIELNGAASEATSIYDARNSLWSAYRTLFQQWKLVFVIGAANRRLGSAPTALFLLWRTWRQAAALTATYPAAD